MIDDKRNMPPEELEMYNKERPYSISMETWSWQTGKLIENVLQMFSSHDLQTPDIKIEKIPWSLKSKVTFSRKGMI